MAEVGITDLHKAVFTVWANHVHQAFSAYREPNQEETASLFDAWGGSAAYPYCIFIQDDPEIVSRMTGDSSDEQRIIQRVPVTFRIHAQATNGQSADFIASELAEVIREVFGGHPTKRAAEVCMDSNAHVYTQFQSEESSQPTYREETLGPVLIANNLMEWSLFYDFIIDQPVKI